MIAKVRGENKGYNVLPMARYWGKSLSPACEGVR